LYYHLKKGGSVTERVGNEGQDQKRGNNWGLFHLFVLISAALIIALWGVIIRGGEPPPLKTAYVVERPVVLLFLVDTAVKRYAHYESGRYPEQLPELLPRYLPVPKEEFSCLDTLSYSTDPTGGYRLALTDRNTGDVMIMLSPQGIVNMRSSVKES
jgi:hypothetical protein